MEPSHDHVVTDALVISLLPTVNGLAAQIHRHCPQHDYQDLVSAGICGLMEAVRRFKPGQEHSLERYAFARIRGAMIDSIRAEDPASRGSRQQAREIEEAIRRLSIIFGRGPTEIEVASYLNLPLGRYQAQLAQLWQLRNIYLDPAQDVSFLPIAQRSPYPNGMNPHECYERKEVTQILVRYISGLPAREQTVIKLYYYEELTLKEIGARLGITESYASKIHARALLLLKAAAQQNLKADAMGHPGKRPKRDGKKSVFRRKCSEFRAAS
ncbi:MAG: sigma-70 family RNA polymerase sigma factor [Acidobacterium ailaaui]|nr:sigma-70 family RNA polymerase sigma factor [Pseudacidobacterium ailaaui]